MAGDAGRGREIVIVVYVALGASHRGMRSRQGKSDRVVIECGRLPGSRAMACLAGCGKPRSGMVRVCCLLVVGQMAADAIGRRTRKFSSNVAGGAVKGGVRPGERKACKFQMIKLGAQPCVHVVTLFAGRGETRCNVVGAGRRLVVLRMAGVTLSRQSLKLASRRAGVAGLAIKSGMRPQQWKSILVLIDLLD